MNHLKSAAIHAPVLQLANVFDPSLCQRLIEAHLRQNKPGSVMLVKDGEYQPGVDVRVKNRLDHRLRGALLEEVWARLCAQAWPAAAKAFTSEITRFEYIDVGCYVGDEGGHFVPHNDNGSPLTAHRRFALSVNLNDDYDGGQLYFPEYESAEYRPPSGSGVLFSCSLTHAAAPVTRGKRYVLVAMLGTDADLEVYETVRGDDWRVKIDGLETDARRLRLIAADVVALGARLSPRAAVRLKRIRTELESLEKELRTLRPSHLLDKSGEPPSSGLRLNLGCGGHRIEGWINIDSRGGDLRMNLRWPLPFRDASVRYVFACHVAEHLYRRAELPDLLKEIRRVLVNGGVLRIVTPDIEQCLRAYVANDDQFFADRSASWPWAAQCKTRLEHFLSYAGASQALEDLDGHKYGYDFETLANALADAGFTNVYRSSFMASAHPDLRVDEGSHNARANSEGRYYSLFVEAC